MGSLLPPQDLRLGPGPFLAPNHRGSGCVGPGAGFSSLPLSLPVSLVTFSVCLHPCLCFLISLYHLLFSLSPSARSAFSVSSFFLPLPPLAHDLCLQVSPVFLLCSTWVSPLIRFSFLSSVPSPPSFMSSLCFPLPATLPQLTNSYMSQKRKKEKKKSKHKKAKQKQILSVLQSAASSWWPLCVSLWPAACPPAPARPLCVLPACPSC